MAEITTLALAEINSFERCDAEFFAPSATAFIHAVKKTGCQPLGDFLSSAKRGQAPEYNPAGGIPVVRTANVRDLEFSDVRQEYVTRSFFDSTVKGAIGPDDLAVTSTGVGTLGRVFCNISGGTHFADGHITVLKAKSGVDVCYLAAALQSRIGQVQFERWQRGSSGQIEIYPEDICNVLIPKLPADIRRRVSSLWRAAVEAVQKSRSLYPEAEQELLERLGWEKIRSQADELFFAEKFSEATRCGRADAEHFQPKYLRLRERLKAARARRIGDFCPKPSRGVQPAFVPDGDVWVLASKAIRAQGVSLDEEGRTSRRFWEDPSNEKAHVRAGDVLLNSTGVGTLGRASFYLDEAAALTDNHVVILRPDEAVCLPVYLSLFLNTPAGLWQSEMFQTGSSGQLEIYPQHIEDIFVFLPRNKDGSVDLAWQRKLADKVTGASRAKQEARIKLNQAKKLVEDYVAKATAS